MQQVEVETTASASRSLKSQSQGSKPSEHHSDSDISCSDISGCTPIPLSNSCVSTKLPANTNSRIPECLTISSSSTTATARKRKIDQSQSRQINPTKNDILLGRGGHSNNNPGNKYFREKALELRPAYETCVSKEEKYSISEDLVHFMKVENRRFLKKNSDGQWYEVLENDARKKASQALRERCLSTSLPAEYDF
jgi:hypothetical protein